MNIIDWMVENKYAVNVFAAAHIANGLKLAGVDEQIQQEMVKAYRRWRDAGESSKVCYANVLDGKEPPAELFVEDEEVKA